MSSEGASGYPKANPTVVRGARLGRSFAPQKNSRPSGIGTSDPQLAIEDRAGGFEFDGKSDRNEKDGQHGHGNQRQDAIHGPFAQDDRPRHVVGLVDGSQARRIVQLVTEVAPHLP